MRFDLFYMNIYTKLADDFAFDAYLSFLLLAGKLLWKQKQLFVMHINFTFDGSNNHISYGFDAGERRWVTAVENMGIFRIIAKPHTVLIINYYKHTHTHTLLKSIWRSCSLITFCLNYVLYPLLLAFGCAPLLVWISYIEMLLPRPLHTF